MMRTFDQIIDANMTVTDHRLRDAIHAVIVDAIHEAVEQEREACAKLCEENLSHLEYADDYWNRGVRRCAAAIRAQGEK